MSDIGIARKQRVFATMESVLGTLIFPVGTTDFIRPAGNAVMNQNPEFSDSEELQDTLDVLDRFQNALPAGHWSLPMYLRPDGAKGIQGKVLFEALQHGCEATVTAVVAVNVTTTTAATVGINTVSGGLLPEKGVVKIGAEKIQYNGIIRASRSTTVATLTNCVRGYASTTAATHDATQAVSVESVFFSQDSSSPSFSLWIETDHFVQGMSGCSVDEASFEVTNEGAVKVTFSGQGMNMFFAGAATVTATALATNVHIHVADAKRFTEGAYIYIVGGNKYATIATVDSVNNVLYISTAIGAAATGDTIRGYLPPGTVIGEPIESRNTSVEIDGISAKIKSGTLTARTTKKYLIDEVGTDHPEEFLEEQREITSDLTVYFKKSNAKYFTTGLEGDEATFRITFGDEAGSILDLYMPKVSLQVPEINFASPAVELRMPAKALGTVGEDSLEIVLR